MEIICKIISISLVKVEGSKQLAFGFCRLQFFQLKFFSNLKSRLVQLAYIYPGASLRIKFHLTHRASDFITGFPLFPSHKFPWLFQYFFHFSLTFIKYFYGFYSILLHALKYSFYNKNIYFTSSKILSWNSNNLTLNTLWACSWDGVVHTLPKKGNIGIDFVGKIQYIF